MAPRRKVAGPRIKSGVTEYKNIGGNVLSVANRNHDAGSEQPLLKASLADARAGKSWIDDGWLLTPSTQMADTMLAQV